MNNNYKNIEVGKTYKVRVVDNRATLAMPEVECINKTNENLDNNKAFRNFIEEYILINEGIEMNSDDDKKKEDFEIEQIYKHGKALVTELMYIVDYQVSIEKDIASKFNLLNLAKIISTISGNRTYLYFKAQTDFLLALYRFANSNTDVIQFIDDNIIKKFPSLITEKKIIDVLSKIKKPAENEDLFLLTTSDLNSQISSLAKLILAYNLIQTSIEKTSLLDEIREAVCELFIDGKYDISRSKIVPVLSVEEKKEKVSNLGSEGQYKEFKTSLVFSASVMSTII